MPIFLILLLVLMAFAVFALAVFYLMTRYRRIMLWVCFGFVAAGFLLYTAGYLSSGAGFIGTLYAALRGIFSAARMLFINDDHGVLNGIEGTQWLTENKYALIFFWLCHVSALIIASTALIGLFGRKLMDEFRLRFGFHKEVYIIKGADENALMLGENLATHDAKRKHPDNNRLIVFLLKEDDNEKKIGEKAARFGGVVQVLEKTYTLLSCLRKAGINRKRVYIILMPDDASLSDDTRCVVEYAKEKNMHPEGLDIFVLTLSEWDREEIEAITQEKENNKRKYPYTVHITNEVDIITRQMIGMHPPFECPGLNFNEKGEASRDFTVIILGFGTMGQRAFLRLVMNGQFAGSRMRAIIIDKDMDNVRDCFLHRYPGLDLCCDMEFNNIDVHCKDFFAFLNKVNNVDYVVIALSSDETNKQTALDIRLHYERKDINALPFIAVSEKKGSLHKVKQDENIFIFGCREEVYKESVIIHAEADRMAKAVNDVYKEMYGGQPWHELDWFLQESNRASADFIPAMLKLAGLDEKAAMSKESLAETKALAEVLSQTEHLRWMAFHAAMGYRPISIKEMQQRFDKYNGELKSRKHLDYCRRDSEARLHSCLVSWDELDKVSEVYRELAHRAGNTKEQKRDFKDNDRDIIKHIPLFLKASKEDPYVHT